MRPKSYDLAMRDSALAAFIGAIPANFGSDDRADFGAEFAGYPGSFGDSWGDDWGADAAPAPAAGMPSKSEAIAAWHAHKTQQAHTTKRTSLLEPNKNSTVKVERYTFPLNQTFTLGVLTPLALSGQPDTTIRPERVTMNAPTVAFCLISEIKAANVSGTIGGANVSDAFEYNPLGVDQHLDLPLLSPANKISVIGTYTSFVPPGFVGGTSFTFITSFKGWATIAG